MIIVDALDRSQDACADWTWEYFARKHGSVTVLANNRAPARRADAQPGGGGAQKTIALTLAEYIDQHIMKQSDETQQQQQERYQPARQGPDIPMCAPFYVNGWRAFSETDEPLPEPEFAAGIDQTAQIALAIDTTLLGGGKSGTTTATPPAWVGSVLAALTKIFLGPAGTITRLHYDAGSAHGWLMQVQGRKLFVLLPPSSLDWLHVLESEIETVQSPVDPLEEDPTLRWPRYASARPLVAIVAPGEAILVPQGWWHYAVALEPSITLQRNFYHAAANAKGLVAMVLNTARGMKNRMS